VPRWRRLPADPDADLVRRATEGDVDAYATLVRACEPAARRLALLLAGGEADEAGDEAIVEGW
jgi:hypothetical protein